MIDKHIILSLLLNVFQKVVVILSVCVLRKCCFIHVPQQSKLEKADVLEITVQHMDNLQRGNGTGKTFFPIDHMSFKKTIY